MNQQRKITTHLRESSIQTGSIKTNSHISDEIELLVKPNKANCDDTGCLMELDSSFLVQGRVTPSSGE